MKKWVLKAIVQKIISFFPKKEKANYFFQRFVTKGVLLNDTHFGWKINHALDHVAHYAKYAGQNAPKAALELGTGWYPIVPIILYVAGFEKVVSVDIYNWLTKQRFTEALRRCLNYLVEHNISEMALDQDAHIRIKKLKAVFENAEQHTLAEMKHAINLKTYNHDITQLDLGNEAFGLICSNNTYEHIPQKILETIVANFMAWRHPQGIMSHFIDASDHFAHFDTTITDYNFLRYSAAQWAVIDNRIQPQNRMRLVDYEQLYLKLNLPFFWLDVRSGNLSALQRTKIHPEFAAYSPAELAATHGYLITKPE